MPRIFKRALVASALTGGAYALWILYMVISKGGDHSFLGFTLVLLAIMGAGVAIAFVPVFWMALAARERRKRGERSARLERGAALLAATALAGLVALTAAVLPDYFWPPYEVSGVMTRDAARDFTAPWGARMLAVTFGPRVREFQGRTLWVSESELTQGEYARIMGEPAKGDAALPLTAISEAQLAELLARANREPSKAAAGGRFRVPMIREALGYSGDWWITSHPKTIYRCQLALAAAQDVAANGLGIRGTTDNAAEIVFAAIEAGKPHHCALMGGVRPYCASPRSERWRDVKFVGVRHCTGAEVDQVFGAPLVGVRLVYSADSP